MVGLKLIYKKSLAIELIKMGNDLEYTARNRNDPRWQVYFFPHTEKLTQDPEILHERLHAERKRPE